MNLILHCPCNKQISQYITKLDHIHALLYRYVRDKREKIQEYLHYKCIIWSPFMVLNPINTSGKNHGFNLLNAWQYQSSPAHTNSMGKTLFFLLFYFLFLPPIGMAAWTMSRNFSWNLPNHLVDKLSQWLQALSRTLEPSSLRLRLNVVKITPPLNPKLGHTVVHWINSCSLFVSWHVLNRLLWIH